MIHGPSDPEEYSWEVGLGEEQELVLIGDQLAIVYYTGREHTAFSIAPKAAHDADGSTVPTSLSVPEENIVTLTVHHRAGNPAAGGAPFVYPITDGAGWEGGFQTELVALPPSEAIERVEEGEAPERCLVPRLKGRSLTASRKRLRRADCKVGRVTMRRGATAGTGRVIEQNPNPGTVLTSGMSVALALGAGPRTGHEARGMAASPAS